MKRISQPQKILIVRLSSLGDIVILTPLLQSLREKFPNAQIDFLIKREFADLVTHNSYLSRVISYDVTTGLRGFLSLARQLAQNDYDLILDMHNNLRSHLLGWICRTPIRRFHKPRLRRFLLFYCWLDFFPRDFNLLSAYYRVVRNLGISYRKDFYPQIYLPSEAIDRARQILKERGIEGDFVVILPIATWQNKLYPLEGYREVAERVERELGLAVVWLGGRYDIHLQKLKKFSGVKYVLAGETTLTESLTILRLSRAVVGNDTGLTYAAEALGVPTVLILGPTARQTGAGCYRPTSVTIERSLWCRPCSQKGDRACYRRRRYCLEKIHSAEIFSALCSVIKSNS